MKKKLAAFWENLSDQTELPRRLWYPPPPSLPDPYASELWQKQFDEVCTTVRRSMFGLLGYSTFCLIALGQPDAELLREAAVTLPVVNTKVSIAGFMIIGPLVLLGLTAYLHVFIGRWVIMKSGKSMDSLSPPYIFNLPDKSAAVISAFIFYWLPPIVLAVFVYKGEPHTVFDYQILWGSLIVTMVLVSLAIRRCPDARRKFQNPLLWLALIVLFVSSAFYAEVFNKRSLDLNRADLGGVYLRDVDLARAFLTGANLSEANLTNANLTNADLTNADLTNAKLTNAKLTNADLTLANLYFANLTGANLTNANLYFTFLPNADLTNANLTNANLYFANLTGANLIGAFGLNCEQLTVATNWESAFRDPELGCGEPIPVPPEQIAE